jgi:hypothetical protein
MGCRQEGKDSSALRVPPISAIPCSLAHGMSPVISAAKPSQAIHHVTYFTPLSNSVLRMRYHSTTSRSSMICSRFAARPLCLTPLERLLPPLPSRPPLESRRLLPLPYSHHGRASAAARSLSLPQHEQTLPGGRMRSLWYIILFYKI